jgi:CubicO group peptidase (beta-lactamase class C family)
MANDFPSRSLTQIFFSARGHSAFFVLALALFIASCSESDNPVAPPTNEWETVSPGVAGWSASGLEHMASYADSIGYSAIMMLYDGRLMYAWGDTGTTFWVHSIRKALLNSLYGVYVENGTIDLQSTLAKLGIDDIPPSLSDTEKTATVEELLQSRSGVYHEAAAESQSMIDARPERGSHLPGTYFYYNNFDFNLAGAIFEQRVGHGIFDEFQERIAKPLGMEDYLPGRCFYQYELEKSMHPAYHMRMSARDLARYGQLYLQDGVWRGTHILSTDWIDASTTSYSEFVPGYGVGYGYLWYVITPGTPVGDLYGISHTLFYHTGVGTQILEVIPDWKLVMVGLMDTESGQPLPTEAQGDRLLELFLAARNPSEAIAGLQQH